MPPLTSLLLIRKIGKVHHSTDLDDYGVWT